MADFKVKTQADKDAEAMATLRAARTAKLIETDWTQLPDAPLTGPQVEAWKKYRQALRDLPANIKNPHKPTLPKPPA